MRSLLFVFRWIHPTQQGVKEFIDDQWWDTKEDFMTEFQHAVSACAKLHSFCPAILLNNKKTLTSFDLLGISFANTINLLLKIQDKHGDTHNPLLDVAEAVEAAQDQHKQQHSEEAGIHLVTINNDDSSNPIHQADESL